MWENFPIVLQVPFRHFIVLPSRRNKHSTNIFLIKSISFITVAKITLIIPLKPTYIGNVAFISSQLTMRVGYIQLKLIFRRHIVDPHASLHTIVTKIYLTVRLSHIFSEFILYQRPPGFYQCLCRICVDC